jgi:hypothetical protein
MTKEERGENRKQILEISDDLDFMLRLKREEFKLLVNTDD